MLNKKPLLRNNEIYHVVIRGTGDSVIFKNKDDYYRGVFSLFEFNDEQPVLIRERRRRRLLAKKKGNKEFSAKREMMVEILAFCFMPNHIHLLLKQIKNNGITDFMRKLGTGYVHYFNQKYNRKGHLLQGRFRAIHVKNNEQLRNVFAYIHTNPASLIEPAWKERGIEKERQKKVIKFLKKYKWSSYQDYVGKKNFPSVLKKGVLFESFDGRNGCKKVVKEWIEYKTKNRKEELDKNSLDIVLE